MTWFKVDDKVCVHPKFVELRAVGGGMAAVGLWTMAGAFCPSTNTDGRVPFAAVAMLGGTDDQAAMLVQCGLWEEREDGFWFHDWLSHQPSKASVEADRAKARERKRRYEEKRRDTTRSERVTDASGGMRPERVGAVGSGRVGSGRVGPPSSPEVQDKKLGTAHALVRAGGAT